MPDVPNCCCQCAGLERLRSPSYDHARPSSFHATPREEGPVEAGCYSVMKLVEVLDRNLPDQVGICMGHRRQFCQLTHGLELH